MHAKDQACTNVDQPILHQYDSSITSTQVRLGEPVVGWIQQGTGSPEYNIYINICMARPDTSELWVLRASTVMYVFIGPDHL